MNCKVPGERRTYIGFKALKERKKERRNGGKEKNTGKDISTKSKMVPQ
jgi:hypothetical protein